ncbi:sensor histidine kinase [Chitiniphilus eburneus]|uniref:histidine kinase n=1 Tax=Chitiniphilus eburneus TaxID=2571148 RepID=A0A4V5MRU3_9NEIS|nr:ATP-binding protein [Chitiniphilus eburneus]TJZ77628.1 hypothetical protein FAZ21_04700 [Chitiniphilus eburneus]
MRSTGSPRFALFLRLALSAGIVALAVLQYHSWPSLPSTLYWWFAVLAAPWLALAAGVGCLARPGYWRNRWAALAGVGFVVFIGSAALMQIHPGTWPVALGLAAWMGGLCFAGAALCATLPLMRPTGRRWREALLLLIILAGGFAVPMLAPAWGRQWFLLLLLALVMTAMTLNPRSRRKVQWLALAGMAVWLALAVLVRHDASWPSLVPVLMLLLAMVIWLGHRAALQPVGCRAVIVPGVLWALLVVVLRYGFPVWPTWAVALLAGLLVAPAGWRGGLAYREQRWTEALQRLLNEMTGLDGAATHQARDAIWRRLLRRVYRPLNSMVVADAAAPTLDRGQLVLPTPFSDAGLRLTGRQPYRLSHQRLGATLLAWSGQMERGRTAYDRGVAAERQRIARDLHDDLGAALLSALAQADQPAARHAVQAAIAQMRTVVGGLAGEALSLEEVLAQLRHETAQRLDQAGIELDWPFDEDVLPHRLDYRYYKNYMSVFRELVSNAIRHGRPRRLSVRLERGIAGRLVTVIRDDGMGMAAERLGRGHGLSNLRTRMGEIDGDLYFSGEGGGTTAIVVFTPPPSPLAG